MSMVSRWIWCKLVEAICWKYGDISQKWCPVVTELTVSPCLVSMPEQPNRLTTLMPMDSWIVATRSSGYIADGNITPIWHPFTSVFRKAHILFSRFDECPTSFLRTHINFTYLLGEKCIGRVRLTLQLWAVGRWYKKANIILSSSVWEGRNSVGVHILPNTLSCSCLPGKKVG